MGQKNILSFIITILLVISLFSFSTIAVGIRGDNLNIKMDFIPNYEQKLTYHIRPTVGYTQDYRIYTEGSLAQYIELEKDVIRNVGPDDQPPIHATLKLPRELEPGMHKVLIGVVDTVATGGGNAAIGTMTSVRAVVNVRSLYPSAYPVLSFQPESVNEGETAEMLVKVSNWGKKPIKNGYAIIRIYDSNDKDTVISEVTTKKVDIISGATKEVSADFDTSNVKSGQYFATVVFKSNAPDVEDEKFFNIGKLEIIIEEKPDKIYAGSVKPIELWLRSRWGKDLDNVFATIRVEDYEADTNIKDLKPWGYDQFRAYIDGTGLTPGKQVEMEVEIKQDDYRNTVTFPVNVVSAPVQESPSQMRMPDLFILLVIFIIAVFGVVNTVMYIKFKRYGEAYQ
jgi:hypothetical protein